MPNSSEPQIVYPQGSSSSQPNMMPAQPSGTNPTPSGNPLPPAKRTSNYFVVAVGGLIALEFVLPANSFAQWLAGPIVIGGVVAAVTFIFDNIRANKSNNSVVKSFNVVGAIGVGIVIFVVCLIAGVIVSTTKDPNYVSD